MVAKRCEQCGKRILGYNDEHVYYLLLQHKLVHRNKKEVKKDNEGNTSKPN